MTCASSSRTSATTARVDQLAAGVVPDEATLVGRFSPRTRVLEGDAVEVVVDQRALHFFDLETGRAIRDEAVAPSLRPGSGCDEPANERPLGDDEHDQDGKRRYQHRECKCGPGRLKMSDSPTCTGNWFSFGRITYGRKKLFQLATKLKKTTSAMMGLASGIPTRRKAAHSLQPVDPRRVQDAVRERGRVVEVGEVDAEGKERERQDDRERVADQSPSRSAPGRSGARATPPA